MQTFDQALYKLYSAGEITYDAALAHADSPNNLRLMIKLGVDADPRISWSRSTGSPSSTSRKKTVSPTTAARRCRVWRLSPPNLMEFGLCPNSVSLPGVF